jgi:cytoskeletal protein RodZ
MKLREKYGEILTGKRIEKGLTIKQLSEISKLPEYKILNMETEKCGFSWHDIRLYTKALDMKLSEVIYD